MNVDLRALGSIRRSVPQRGGRKIPSVSRRTNMDGGTGISGAAVGVLVDVGCATAISGFTVGSNRTVSALMSTVADEASSKPSNATQKPGEIRLRSRRHQASTPRISAAPDAWSTANRGALVRGGVAPPASPKAWAYPRAVLHRPPGAADCPRSRRET